MDTARLQFPARLHNLCKLHVLILLDDSPHVSTRLDNCPDSDDSTSQVSWDGQSELVYVYYVPYTLKGFNFTTHDA